jgi:hypothetical protein
LAANLVQVYHKLLRKSGSFNCSLGGYYWLTCRALHGEESCESFLEEHEWQSLCASLFHKQGRAA